MSAATPMSTRPRPGQFPQRPVLFRGLCNGFQWSESSSVSVIDPTREAGATRREWVWSVGLTLAVIALLLFPSARLPSRRWRIVLALPLVGQVGAILGSGFSLPYLEGSHVRNPFAIGGPVGAALRPLQALFVLVPIAAILAITSIVVRFRRASGVEREQIKRLFYAGLVLILGLIAQDPMSKLLSSPDAVTNAQNAIISGVV